MVFAKEMGIPHKQFTAITEQLNTKCTKLKVQIACGSILPPASPIKSVSRSPSKRALRELPSGDSPRKAATAPSQLFFLNHLPSIYPPPAKVAVEASST
ncbi:hypothetical protein BDQ17DRAFT_580518 [Cyathus striatus]|nr:hypothetical protein BDQ17DRAFT_580518 [Cyathus striatus]